MDVHLCWLRSSGAPVNQRVPALPNQESILLPEQQISPQRARHIENATFGNYQNVDFVDVYPQVAMFMLHI